VGCQKEERIDSKKPFRTLMDKYEERICYEIIGGIFTAKTTLLKELENV
jgi:hypothetical protein